jgi:hypothetical protein
VSVSRETYLAKLYLDRVPRRGAAPPGPAATAARRRRWARLLAWLRARGRA